MEGFFKRILFFVLMPIYGPLALFSHLTYPWWLTLNSKNNILRRIFFFILAPIYGPITLFLHLTYTWWAELFEG